jgi:hypothetical protein
LFIPICMKNNDPEHFLGVSDKVMMFNATFNNISVTGISWKSLLCK